jgi:RNA polymerase sigma-70 factor (ECF subfamily)
MDTPNAIIDRLYRELRDRLHVFIRSRVRDESAAEDILHDVFLKIHLHIDRLRSSDRMESWLYAIARNAIADHFKKRENTVPNLDELPAWPEEEDAYHKLGRSIHAMIERLPEAYREAIRKTELENLPQKDLAQLFGISLSGAKSRVQRGREMLKELLLECCHFDFDRMGRVIDYHQHTCCCCQKRTIHPI